MPRVKSESVVDRKTLLDIASCGTKYISQRSLRIFIEVLAYVASVSIGFPGRSRSVDVFAFIISSGGFPVSEVRFSL